MLYDPLPDEPKPAPCSVEQYQQYLGESVDAARDRLWQLRRAKHRPITDIRFIFNEIWRAIDSHILPHAKFAIAARETHHYYNRRAWSDIEERLRPLEAEYGVVHRPCE